ncbi:hypothetical protein DICPUDRAFT_6223, partial [Dictyostelium purpureum]
IINQNINKNELIINNNKHIFNNNKNNNITDNSNNTITFNNNKYYSTTKNNNNINILNEFSFKVEKEVRKGDALTEDTKNLKNMNLAVKCYEDALALTRDRIERASIHHRIALVKYRIGLITDAKNSLDLSLKLFTNGAGDSIRGEIENSEDASAYPKELYKVYCLKSIIQEKEFDLKNDPESLISQKILENALDLWKFVIVLNPNAPDGYTGVSRCILKQLQPDLLACFNLSNKALMCSKTHPPSLLLASEMLIIQNKEAIASVILSLFFKHYKEFYQNSLLYTLRPKELVDAHFRYGLTLLKDGKFSKALEEFTHSVEISKSNIGHPNQMNILMINALLEKERMQFENNYNYNNLKMFSEQEKQQQQNLIEQHGLVADYNPKSMGIVPTEDFKFNYNDCSILDIISGHYFRGKTNFQLKRYTEAILDFDYVIEKQPSQIKAFKERAECYKALGDFVTYQKDIKVYNSHQELIKKRKEAHFEDYLDESKQKKDYLQSFEGREEEEDDYSEDYEDDNYDGNEEDNGGNHEDYEEFEDSRYKK